MASLREFRRWDLEPRLESRAPSLCEMRRREDRSRRASSAEA